MIDMHEPTPKGWDAAEWQLWCDYTDAIVRASWVRMACGSRLGNSDRTWWAERDLATKRRRWVYG